MNPVQPPHQVSRETDRRAFFPMIVDIVTHVLDEFRNKMCSHGFMLAPLNSHATWTIVPCIRTDSRKRFSLQAKNERRAKLERSSLQCTMDCANRSVILPEAVSCFGRGFRLGVRDQFRFERAAIPPVALLTLHFLSLANFSASRSTSSRVISSFSKCVLP